jgi:ubiquitin-conjugating enzyme E2 O
MSFSQFDVVQDFSDQHYAKTSAGKVCCHFVNPFFSDILDPTTISHLIVCDQITKDWVKAIQSQWNLLQKKPTWSVYAGYILLRFCFLFLPNYHKL